MLLKRKKINLQQKAGSPTSNQNSLATNSKNLYNVEDDDGLSFQDVLCVGDIIKSNNKYGIICHAELLTRCGTVLSNPVQVLWADEGLYTLSNETIGYEMLVYANPEGMVKLINSEVLYG
jgi:hypothetical protein